MFMESKAAFPGDFFLAPFDGAVDEFFHLAAGGADQVVVMIAIIELEQGSARLELTANDNARFGKLHQYAVDGCEADVDLLVEHETVDLFRRQVLGCALMKELQDAQSWKSRFQAGSAQYLGNVQWFVHKKSSQTLRPASQASEDEETNSKAPVL